MLHNAIKAPITDPAVVSSDDEPDEVVFHLQPDEPKKEPDFFEQFDAKEIADLVVKYAHLNVKNQRDLENLLHNYLSQFYLFKASDAFGNFLNLGYIAFVTTTGMKGLENILRVFFRDLIISDGVAQGIGIPIGVLAVASYMLLFSPTKTAVLLLLEYIDWRQKPVSLRSCELLSWARNAPHKALARFVFEAGLFTTNSLSMMTVLLGFVKYLPLPATIFLTGLVLLFGNKYMANYTNKEARDGLFNYLLNAKQPWLVPKLLSECRLSELTQIATVSGSTLLLMTYPYYYSLAGKTATTFGVSADQAEILSVAGAALSLCRTVAVFHPGVCERYLEPRQKLVELVEKKEEKELAVAKNKSKKLLEFMSQFESEVTEKKGCRSLACKEPIGVFQTFFRFSAGASLAALSYLDPSPATITMMCACFLISAAGARANFLRVKTIETCKALESPVPENKVEIRKRNCRDIFISMLAILFSGASASSDMLAVLGSLLIENDAAKLFFPVLAFDRMLTALDMNYRKTDETMHAVFGKKTTFFVPAPAIAPTKSVNSQSPLAVVIEQVRKAPARP